MQTIGMQLPGPAWRSRFDAALGEHHLVVIQGRVHDQHPLRLAMNEDDDLFRLLLCSNASQ